MLFEILGLKNLLTKFTTAAKIMNANIVPKNIPINYKVVAIPSFLIHTLLSLCALVSTGHSKKKLKN